MADYSTLKEKLANTHIPALDGIRFLAVFLVIFSHCNVPYVPGEYGVTMFFVVSGFLITWLLLKENTRDNSVSLKGFYRRRIYRILPAFYVYSIFTIVMMFLMQKHIPWEHIFSAFFYFSNYYWVLHPDSNNAFTHTWSLAIEEQFYIIFPLIFLLLCRRLKTLAVLLSTLIVAVAIWRIAAVDYFGFDRTYLLAGFETRADCLAFGCLAAVSLKIDLMKRFWNALVSSPATLLLTVVPLVICIYTSHEHSSFFNSFVQTSIALLTSLLIIQLIGFSDTFAGKWLERPTIKYLGKISYSVYLYQQLVTGSLIYRISEFPFVLQLFILVTVTVALATISYYFVEKPFLRLKNGNVKDFVGEIKNNFQWLRAS